MNVCVPLDSAIENLMPRVDGIKKWVFREVIKSRDGALMNGTKVTIKRSP